jgi:hypothetical protein
MYALRVAIRSRALSKMRHSWNSKVRKTSGLPATAEIPTSVVLQYGWQSLHRVVRVGLVTIPVFTIVMTLVLVFSHKTVFRVFVSIVLVFGAFPVVGSFLFGHRLAAIKFALIIAWILAIFSVTIEKEKHLNTLVKALASSILTTVFVSILAVVTDAFRRPRETAILFILPLWLVEFPIAIIVHFYQIFVPQWEPFVLTISIQGVVIVFGIFVCMFEIDRYCGLPELAALIGVIIGIPTSMIWQYLPPHGNPIPQYGVIALTFGCSAIFCFLLSVWRRLRRLGDDGKDLAYFVQAVTIYASTSGLPIALAWAYYPTYGRLYTNGTNLPGVQNLSDFYRNPIHLWIQVSITFGAAVFCAIAIMLHPLFRLNSKLCFLAWATSGLAMVSWLPTLLWIDDIEAFKQLTTSHWKRIHLTWMSILFWIIIWIFLWRFGRRYLKPKWREETARHQVYSEGGRSGMGEYSLRDDLNGRESVTAVHHLRFPEGSV